MRSRWACRLHSLDKQERGPGVRAKLPLCQNSNTPNKKTNQTSTAMLSEKLEEDVREVVKRSHRELFARGKGGVVTIRRAFYLADTNGDGLDREEFAEAMNHAGVFLTKQEIGSLYRYIDRDHSGRLSLGEVLDVLVPPLSEHRRRYAETVFDKLDKDGSGVLTLDELAAAYQAQNHPRVQSGEWTKARALAEVIDAMERDGTRDGEVSRDEFLRFYRELSCSIPSDDLFDRVMEHCWGVSVTEVDATDSTVSQLLSLLREKVRQRTHTGHFDSVTLKNVRGRGGGGVGKGGGRVRTCARPVTRPRAPLPAPSPVLQVRRHRRLRCHQPLRVRSGHGAVRAPAVTVPAGGLLPSGRRR